MATQSKDYGDSPWPRCAVWPTFDWVTATALASAYEKAVGVESHADSPAQFVGTLEMFACAVGLHPSTGAAAVRKKARRLAVLFGEICRELRTTDSAAWWGGVALSVRHLNTGQRDRPADEYSPEVFGLFASRLDAIAQSKHQSAAAIAAEMLHREFSDRGLRWTVQPEGFSAKCLRAILDLSGHSIGRDEEPTDRVDYYLRLARDKNRS